MLEDKPNRYLCFIAMPFGDDKKDYANWEKENYSRQISEADHWNNVYENIIKKAVALSGYEIICRRADTDMSPATITSEILDFIYSDYLAIVDITSKNPNVFYELGLRDSWHNKTILISAEITPPFDIYGQRVLQYKVNDSVAFAKFCEQLENSLSGIISEPMKTRNLVQQFLLNKNTDTTTRSIREREIVGKANEEQARYKKRLDNILTFMRTRYLHDDDRFYDGFQICTVGRRYDRLVTTTVAGSLFQDNARWLKALFLIYKIQENMPSELKFIKVSGEKLIADTMKDDEIREIFIIFPTIANDPNRFFIAENLVRFFTPKMSAKSLADILMFPNKRVPEPPSINVEIWDSDVLGLLESDYDLRD